MVQLISEGIGSSVTETSPGTYVDTGASSSSTPSSSSGGGGSSGETWRETQQREALEFKARKQAEGKFGGIGGLSKTQEALRKLYQQRAGAGQVIVGGRKIGVQLITPEQRGTFARQFAISGISEKAKREFLARATQEQRKELIKESGIRALTLGSKETIRTKYDSGLTLLVPKVPPKSPDTKAYQESREQQLASKISKSPPLTTIHKLKGKLSSYLKVLEQKWETLPAYKLEFEGYKPSLKKLTLEEEAKLIPHVKYEDIYGSFEKGVEGIEKRQKYLRKVQEESKYGIISAGAGAGEFVYEIPKWMFKHPVITTASIVAYPVALKLAPKLIYTGLTGMGAYTGYGIAKVEIPTIKATKGGERWGAVGRLGAGVTLSALTIYGGLKGLKSKGYGLGYEKVEVPTVKGTKIAYKGLRLQLGSKAYGIVGKTPKGWKLGTPKVDLKTIYFHPTTGVLPETPLATKMYLKGVKQYYPGVELQKLKSALRVMKATQFQKSRFITKFPKETKTLSPKGIKIVKKFAKLEGAEIYGSYGAKGQMPLKIKGHKIPMPSDIDIQLKVKEQEALLKTQLLLQKLKRVGIKARISKRHPTLIETYIKEAEKKWVHAVDIHSLDTPLKDILMPSAPQEYAYGLKLGQPTIKIEGIDVMPLSEQAIRKGASAVRLRKLGVAPAPHRAKDIPHFILTEEVLLASGKKSISPLTQLRMAKGQLALEQYKKLIGFNELALLKEQVRIKLFSPKVDLPITKIFPSPPVKIPIRKPSPQLLKQQLKESISPKVSSPKISQKIISPSIPSLKASLKKIVSRSISTKPSPSRSISPSLSPSLSPAVYSPKVYSPKISSPSPSPSPMVKLPSPSPSPSPTIKEPKVIPPFLRAFLKKRIVKRKLKKRVKGKKQLWYLPGFTSKMLEQNIKMTEKQMRKLLKTKLTGLEIRPGIIKIQRRSRKRKRRK